MHILVTGGAGFIGSHLVKALLDQGHSVVVVDDLSAGDKKNIPEQAEFVKGDIRDIEKLDLPARIDAVFHLAAQIDVRESVNDPMADAAINILGTIAVLNYAVKAGAKKFVYSSTGGVIYGSADKIPTPEDAPCLSSSPYGMAKLAAEQYVRLFSRMHRLPHLILRYSNVYGPGQSGSKETGVIAIFTANAVEGKPLTIYGNGEQTRDFVFVDDVVTANLIGLDSTVEGVFNIATGVETNINQLADLIKKVSKTDLDITHAPERPGEERRSCLDIKKAKKQLSWKPKIKLSKGIKMTFKAQ